MERFQQDAGLAVTGVVDVRTGDALSAAVERRRPCVVRGQVRTPNGTPVPGVRVSVTDRSLDGERPVGATTTDADRRYDIVYTVDDLAGEPKVAADLVLRVLGSGDPLSKSPVAFTTEVPGEGKGMGADRHGQHYHPADSAPDG